MVRDVFILSLYSFILISICLSPSHEATPIQDHRRAPFFTLRPSSGHTWGISGALICIWRINPCGFCKCGRGYIRIPSSKFMHIWGKPEFTPPKRLAGSISSQLGACVGSPPALMEWVGDFSSFQDSSVSVHFIATRIWRGDPEEIHFRL